MARRAAGLGLAAVALALPPAAARANDYVVHSCAAQAGQVGTSAGWRFSRHGHSGHGFPRRIDQCPQGIGLTAQLGGMKSSGRHDSAGFTFAAPPGTSLAAITLLRRVVAAGDYGYELAAHGATNAVLERCQGAGCGGLAGSRSITLPAATRSITFRVFCAPAHGRCAPVGAPAAVQATIGHADITIADTTVPRVVVGPTGALFANQLGAGGVRNFTITAADAGAGVSSVSVAVDGATVASYPVGTCQGPIVSPRPCPGRIGLNLPLNTATLGNGAHAMQVTVTDEAGNTATGPQRFFSSYNAGQAGAYAWLDGSMRWHGHRGGLGLTVPYGAKPTIAGVLLNAAAKPMAGAPVQLQLGEARSGAFTVVAQATTDALGHFTLTVPVTPSADARVAYAPAGPPVALKTFRLTERAAVTMGASPHVLRNGQRVTFSGRVLGGPIPAAGVLVQIQGLNGHRWQEIGTARAVHGSGRYRLRFPFTHVSRFTRFEFRAKVLRESGYPYATGFSRVRSVLVRP